MTRAEQRTASAPPLPPAPPHPNGGPGQPTLTTVHGPAPIATAPCSAPRASAPTGLQRARRRRRTVTRRLIWVAVLLCTAAIAIGVALRVTPQQTVTVAGQVIKVGTTAPSLSVSGPGEVNLFGQSLPTHVHFLGPVRPSLTLTQITINSQLTDFVQGAGPAGADAFGQHPGQRLDPLLPLGNRDHRGGRTVLLGALAGWRRLPHRTTVKLLAGGLVATEVINLGAIMLTAYTAPGTLRQVRSLSQLVGSEPQYPDSKKTVPVPPGVRVVVMGDSTASGAACPGSGTRRTPTRCAAAARTPTPGTWPGPTAGR